MARDRRGRWKRIILPAAGLLGLLIAAACTASDPSVSNAGPETPSDPARDFRIVTLLPRDAIPAIDDPAFYPVEEADADYAPDELVLGVSINGDERAYSVGTLSNHEIVNDTVGGQKIAVTW